MEFLQEPEEDACFQIVFRFDSRLPSREAKNYFISLTRKEHSENLFPVITE